jgi:1-acyl-sn-glycerol-3-phosphate acyltransferase
VPVRFVAKSEIRRWPLVGWLCEMAGTVFIRQARRHDTMRVNAEIAAALEAGDIFAVFPEGTTTDGASVIKFHSSLLEPALSARATVQPVALRYTRSDGSLCEEVSYAGERSLWDTVRDMTRLRAITVDVSFLPALPAEAGHRRELARAAEDAIRQALPR